MHKPLHKHPVALRHCVILTGIFGLVLLVIFFTHPGCVYGSQTDWSNQHFEIPEYFRTRFYATGNLFPDFALHLGGGQNIYNFAYYGLYSPVILLSYAFPWLSMANYIMISHILLTLLSAILCYFWLRKWFPPKRALYAVALFLLSAPLIFHSHHHIMFVNYFPFLFWGLFSVHKALEKRFSLGLIISSVCVILTSFFFSVGAFLTLILYGIFLTLYQHQIHIRKQLLRTGCILCSHLLLAILISAFLLLPVTWTLLSGRDASDTAISLWRILMPSVHVRYLAYSPFSPGLTSIGILSAAAMIQIPERSYRFLSATFLTCIFFPAILYFMNGTMYLDPKAYIPLLPLLVLLCGFFLSQLHAKQIHRKHTAILFAAILVLALFTGRGTTSETIALMLDGTITLFAFCLYSLKKKRAYLLIPTMAMSTAMCLIVNIGDTYMKKTDLDIVYSSEIQSLVDSAVKTDSSFYRISNEYHAGDTVNRIWGSQYYRSSVYSSIHNAAFSDFYFQQAHNENSIRNAAMIVQSKNPIFGMLMGERYLITEKKLHRYGLKLLKEENGYRLYENTLVFPIGFATSHIITQETVDQAEYPKQLEMLLENAIVAKENLPAESTAAATQCNQIQTITPHFTASALDSDKITDIGAGYYVHSKEDFHVTLTLEQPITKLLFLKFHVDNHLGSGSTTGDVSITINGTRNRLTDPKWKYQNGNNDFQYVLSSQKPIQSLQITLSAGDYVVSDASFYTMDYEALEQAAQQVDALQVDSSQLGDDTINGTIQVQNDGWFVLSIPYDEGFSIQVDGKDTDYFHTDTDFIGFPIAKGSHKVHIVYHAPLAKAGKAVSAVGIGITGITFAGNAFLRRRKKKPGESISAP